MAISSARTALKECDLMEDKLPKLATTPISVCRRLVLQQAIQILGLSMNEKTTYDNETDDILTAVRIDVPPQIRLTWLEKRLFYGDWSLTSDATIQSACFNALVCLQEVNVLIIYGIHSAELQHCQLKLLQSSSWAEAFEQHAGKLESKPICNGQGQNRSPIRLSEPIENQCDTRNHRQRVPSGPAHSSVSKLSAMDKGKTTVLPISENQEKIRMTEEMTDPKGCTDEHVFTPSGPAQIAENVAQKPECTLPSLSTPPSVSGTIILRCKNIVPLYSKVRKPLFQDSEDKVKATNLGANVLESTEDLGETDGKTEP